jgi:hypothetical protein
MTAALTIDQNPVQPGYPAKLTATASQDVGPTPYFLWLVDADTGATLAHIGSGTSISVTIYYATVTPRHFSAYLGTSTTSPSTAIAESDLTVTFASMTVSLAASLAVVEPGQYSVVTATSNYNVGLTNYYTQIWDDDTHTLLASCGNGSTCSTNLAVTSVGTRHVVATVGYYSSTWPLSNLQAESAQAGVTLTPFTVSLSPASAAITASTTSTLTATANHDVGPTPYFIVIKDATSGTTLASCGSGKTCQYSVSVTFPQLNRLLVAQVTENSTAQATSTTSTVSLLPWSLKLTLTNVNGVPMLDAYSNHDVGWTPYDLMIYNADGPSLLARCIVGTHCSVTAASMTGDYVAFVADSPTVTTATPDDVQAEAIPDGHSSDRHLLPVTTAEMTAAQPGGDPKDAAAYRPTGDGYRDALFGYIMLAFNAAHATAVSLRTGDAGTANPTAEISADFGNFGSILEPDGLFPRPGVVPGAGRGGGNGVPDLTATSASNPTRVWEMKFDSTAGLAAGTAALTRYTSMMVPPGIAGQTFAEPSQTKNDPMNGLAITVRSSSEPGVELYDIDGGSQRLYQTVITYLSQLGITQQAALQGQVTENTNADGSFTIAGLTGTVTLVPMQVTVPVAG